MPFTTHLYIDPGVTGATGLALFRFEGGTRGRLIWASSVRAKSLQGAVDEVPREWRGVCGHAAWAAARLYPERVTIELPQSYRAGAQPGDQNDLITLAVICGAWAGLAASHGVTAEYVKPAAWKGQLDKSIWHARMIDPKQAHPLDPAERAVLAAAPGVKLKTVRHNIYDAVCMGLVLQGRIR
jgi:hypothetical protein